MNKLYLPENYTRLEFSEEDKNKAIDLAARRTMSPHEWTWTNEEAGQMAKYCLWAAQRLDIIHRFSTMESAVRPD